MFGRGGGSLGCVYSQALMPGNQMVFQFRSLFVPVFNTRAGRLAFKWLLFYKQVTRVRFNTRFIPEEYAADTQ